MSAATDLYYELVIDCCGRPLTTNASDKLHPIPRSLARHEWRDATTVLARANHLPRMPALSLVVHARYKTRRSPSDIDAISPSVKGVLDGLVVAQIIPDDCPPFVRSLVYLAPELGTGLPDALIVRVHPETPA